MGTISKAEHGRRIIAALEQVANDPTISAAKRREAARRLAEWQKASN